MKKLVYLLLFLFFLCTQLQAQNQSRVITGKVSDERGNAVSSASVIIKGTSAGTTTNSDGMYLLTLPSNARTLVISSVNMEPQEITIGSQSEINVTLEAEDNTLSEVVVIGYGTQRRRDVTGSIYKLKDSTLKNIPLQGPDQALRGRVPGVTVTQSSGTPGSAINVLMRSIGSLTANTQPLYVIDGVILQTGSFSQLFVGGQELNALADINPNDIESYEVLKDAAAAAIYGTRGANGVVLITTKKGANQRTRINIDIAAGPQKVWRKIPTLSGPDYVKLIQEEVTNYAQQFFGVDLKPSDFGLAGVDGDPATYPSTYWQDHVFRTGNQQTYQASATGGNDKTQFYVSGGYAGQKGIMIGSDYKRYSGRLNLDNRVSANFKISTGLSVSRSLTNRISNDNNIYGVLSTAVLNSSFYNPYDSNGNYAYDPNLGILENPIAAGTLRYNKGSTERVIGNIAGEYQLLPSLSLRVQGSADYITFNEAQFLPSNTKEGASGPNGVGRESYSKQLDLLNENILTYRKSFGDHSITATAVASYNTARYESIYGEGKNFPGNGVQRLSAASIKSSLSSTGYSFGFIGYLGRVNYDYQDKYYLSASVRRDGASSLGKSSRYGTFPAISGAWRVSEEKFLKGNKTISELKIRGSWGKLGNAGVASNASRALVTPGSNYVVNGADVPGFAPAQIGNNSLQFEETQQADIGLELGLFKNRVLLTADVYQKITNDLLLFRPLVTISGFSGVNQNIGKLENKGLELALNTTNFNTKVFTWSTNFNISFNKNTVKKISGVPFVTGFASWVEAGYPLSSFRGYKTSGIFQLQSEIDKAPFQSANTRPGDIQFADIDGNDTVNSKDQMILGNANPKFSGGLTNTFSYKGIELSAFLQFVSGNKVYNANRVFAEGANSLFGQYATVNNRWTPTNTNTNIPRAVIADPADNGRVSDRWLEDGSYLRLKNVILAYSLPRSLISTLKINSLKVFVQAQNLKTWTRYTGFDPEVSTLGITSTAQGTDFLTYPQARSFTVGLNLGL